MTFLRRMPYGALVTCGVLLMLFFWGTGGAYSAYRGREDGASWRKAALERIEKIRKADMTVLVVDSKGRPVPGAQVKVAMRRSAFGFGSAVTAKDLTDPSEDGRRYREIVERDFNKVVLENDLKWGGWEEGMKRRPNAYYNMDNTFAALRWLRERGILVRGHYVAWAPLASDYGTVTHAKNDGPDFRAALLRHAEEEVRQVGGLVCEWDVVNHPLGWGGKTIRDIAGDDIYDVMFRKVREWNPEAVRCINEGGVLSDSGRNKQNQAYFKLISDMLGRGVPVQKIGFMGHFFAEKDLTPPDDLLKILDRYATLGLPLQVTEFDVRYGKAGESVDLKPEQEQLQADYTRDFLIAMFSHPAVTGVLTWGFWEGRHWYPSAAMYRKDWSLKPNGQAWEDLVLKQWRTNVTGRTDADGRASTRGFLGDYAVDAVYKGRKGSATVTLGAPGASVTVVVQ